MYVSINFFGKTDNGFEFELSISEKKSVHCTMVSVKLHNGCVYAFVCICVYVLEKEIVVI